MVYHWLNRLQRRLWPSPCTLCLGPDPSSRGLCPDCLADLPRLDPCCPRCALPLTAPDQVCGHCQRRPPRFDAAVALFRYAPPVDALIHGLKFGQALHFAPLFAELLATRLAGRPPPDCILPVPLHPRRLMQRGYNQALELARAVGTRCAIPVAVRATRRVRATDDQIGQSAAARRRNMRRAFVVEQDLSGLHIALVDDVMTTGATLDELARVCRAAGAARIEAWAVARTP